MKRAHPSLASRVATAIMFSTLAIAQATSGTDDKIDLEVVVPTSRNLADVTAKLHNNGAEPIFLDPTYPQATAFVEALDPSTGQWRDVSDVARCSTVDPGQTFRVDPGQTFTANVFLDSFDAEYEACLEFEKALRVQYEWQLKRGEAGGTNPGLADRCVPPDAKLVTTSLRLRMEYSTRPWSLLSTSVRTQTVYSEAFCLSEYRITSP